MQNCKWFYQKKKKGTPTTNAILVQFGSCGTNRQRPSAPHTVNLVIGGAHIRVNWVLCRLAPLSLCFFIPDSISGPPLVGFLLQFFFGNVPFTVEWSMGAKLKQRRQRQRESIRFLS